ncbi:MAG: hypothetical protein JST62_01060 [Bacteroidetes bacterium]|nr:hypothetical protein [Bacteroidota bacterium]
MLNYNGSYNRNKKRSGCQQKSVTRNGVVKEIIHGWKYTKRDGLVSFVATVAKDKYQTQKDKEKYIAMVAKVESRFGSRLYWCWWNKQKRVLWMPNLKMVASPGQNYWSYLRPKNR